MCFWDVVVVVLVLCDAGAIFCKCEIDMLRACAALRHVMYEHYISHIYIMDI